MGSALSFGITIVINRSLASTSGLGTSTVLAARFGIAGVVLLAVLAVRSRSTMLPVEGERWRVFLLGALGYASEAAIFFLALGEGTAAAVSLLFYTYPALVTVAEIALGWEPARRTVFGALGLSIMGSVLVVAGGAELSITGAGVLLALGSAVAVTVFLLASDRLVRRSDPQVVGAWMALGAATSFIVRGALGGVLRAPDGAAQAAAMVGNGVATSAAFVLLFAGMRLLGPTRAAVVMTLEAFFAIVLAALFLGEGITVVQAVGGVAILGATAVIALRRPPVPAEP